MRVFYTDKMSETSRSYYVKIDNMNVSDELKGYKMLNASTPRELLKYVKKYYNLEDLPNIQVQLWSNQMYGGVRLDIMEEIPKKYEFMWVRILLNRNSTP